MIKKILNIAVRVIVGIFVLYVLAGFVVLPLALSWAIKTQGTKALRHQVVVRSVRFNPFLLRLDIKGLKILDNNKLTMAGFEKFMTDVSFLGLLKKEYRVESVQVDGLQVNVALLPGNRVNLQDLVPAPAVQASPSGKAAAGPGSPDQSAAKAAPQPLPVVIVDDIVLRQGGVHFSDQTIAPWFSTSLSDINIHVTGLTTRPDCQARVEVQAKIDGKGAITNELLVRPFKQPLELETTFSLNGYALNVLTPYVGKYTGRSLKDGRMEFKMDYRISGNKLTASHKVLIQRFEFGGKVESKDALPLPFGMAVALLEDPQGRISITLPVSGDMSKPDFHYWHLVGQVVRNFFMGLVTKPFSFLASALGAESGTDELGYVRFLPGKADLSEAEEKKLKTLIKGLEGRPKLNLEINGGYDEALDWKAIKIDVLDRDFKELRAQSSRPDSWIYQMLFQRRFGIRDLWALTKKYKVKEGEYEDGKLVEELKRQLIESGEADKAALEALGAARAKVIYDRMIADGMDSKRIRTGGARPSQASMGFVPSEFTLTVFGETDGPPAQPAAPGTAQQ